MSTTLSERREDGHHSNRSSMIGLHDLSESDVTQNLTAAERQDGKLPQDLNKDAAYRKLYGIVTIMTFLLFVLNIIQVCLLDRIYSLYWILICPGIIFVAFTSWAVVFIYSNRKIFYDQSSRAAKDGENARQHLKALFSLQGRSERSKQYDGREPNWPARFARSGILLTAYLNIILCQFIYLPIFALPDFRQITWRLESDANDSIPTPSFAIIRDTTIPRRATIEEDFTTVEQLCAEKRRLGKDQFCFQNTTSITLGEPDSRVLQYAIFDGGLYPNISVTENLDLWYPYSYDGNVTPDPLLSLAVFRQDMIPSFKHAYQCGIISSTLFPVNRRVQINLQQNDIYDDHGALNLKGECKNHSRISYSSYDIDVINLGDPSDRGYNHCDLNNRKKPYNGSCKGDLTFAFTSRLTRVYTSQHGKDWITILTEEGGVVGFVTFLTWFFGIFSI